MKPTKKGVKKGVKKEPTQQPKVEATPTKETTPVPTTTQTTETAPVPTTTPTTETTPSPTTEITPTPTPETPTPAPYQLTPTELLAKQRQQEENKNLYIFAVNKKIKAINKKISKIQKLEQLQKSGKELENKQLETIERLKTHQKKLANWEELKKNYIQIWENQKTNDPSKLIFSLINAIAVETKAHNDKFAVQTGRLSKLRDLFFKEATGFSDFQKTVDNSLSLLQKFIESSNDVAFDEITFKQLRADLLEVTLAINGFAQLESNKNKKLEKKRLKEQEEQERKLKEEQQKNQAQSGNQKGGNRNNNNKGGNRNNNNNRNRDNNNRNRDNNNRNRDNNNRNRDNNRDNNNKN